MVNSQDELFSFIKNIKSSHLSKAFGRVLVELIAFLNALNPLIYPTIYIVSLLILLLYRDRDREKRIMFSDILPVCNSWTMSIQIPDYKHSMFGCIKLEATSQDAT